MGYKPSQNKTDTQAKLEDKIKILKTISELTDIIILINDVIKILTE